MTDPIPPLSFRAVRPFDAVYDDVTARMNATIGNRSNGLSSDARSWLRALVAGFRRERRLWDGRGELAGYRAAWLRLRTRALRLGAGAYLHVSYDLPRAIADDWPTTAAWPALTEADAEAIYDGLRGIFVDSFGRSARDFSVVGLAVPLGWMPRGVGGWIVAWVLMLRAEAWKHARKLATQPGLRPAREAAMAEAMTAALEDVSTILSWEVSLLLPPILRSPPTVAVAAALPLISAVVSLAAAGAVVAAQIIGTVRRRRRSEARFLALAAQLISDYMSLVIDETERFEDALRTRRAEVLRQFDPVGRGLS